MYRFADPYFLYALLIIPILIYLHMRSKSPQMATLRYSTLDVVKAVGKSRWGIYRHILFALRMLAIALLIIAIARPQAGSKEEEVTTEGIDIVMALDISSSMLAEDFKPKNRLEVAKIVAKEFVNDRKNDRIGMVVFARQSYTQCPLTLDYGVLLNLIDDVHIGLIEDGTAIGMALANAVNRLRDSKAKSKVIILLTDGRNNAGELPPLTAAQLAKAMNVRIYTVGAGSRGSALYPVQDPIFGKRYVRLPVEIDEELLQQIAKMTGGRYFRAVDKKTLEDVFHEISQLEKTKIEVKEFTQYEELFYPFLLIGLVLLASEVLLANTRLKKIP
ncbi:MAG: aerotolerance regulator BatA [Candidatus Fischerbacteria bacterium RBG_13_37_8]|uniref:Aerotolerance regulator BatA n=1 Tax=Candidatus Fischerbacteria bacterium RBG_13_37_8 TaxID=1817863 RepID=A0A1F5VIR3_9BACT|nr:MAG: aerotolerance regulator BatA [Candidatus Fischerbacteria bacterium RBG_13_37_8]